MSEVAACTFSTGHLVWDGYRANRTRLSVVFDDEGLMADAGLILVATLSARLGPGALVDACVRSW